MRHAPVGLWRAIAAGVAWSAGAIVAAQPVDDGPQRVLDAWSQRFERIAALRTVWRQESDAAAFSSVIDTVWSWPEGFRETVVADAAATPTPGAEFPAPWGGDVTSVSIFQSGAPTVTLQPTHNTFFRAPSEWDMPADGYRIAYRCEWLLARHVGALPEGSVYTSGAVTGATARFRTEGAAFELIRHADGEWSLSSLGLLDASGEVARRCEFSQWRAAPDPIRWAPGVVTVRTNSAQAPGGEFSTSYQLVSMRALPSAPAGMFALDLRDAVMPDREAGVARDSSGQAVARLPHAPQDAPPGWRLFGLVAAGGAAFAAALWWRLHRRAHPPSAAHR